MAANRYNTPSPCCSSRGGGSGSGGGGEGSIPSSGGEEDHQHQYDQHQQLHSHLVDHHNQSFVGMDESPEDPFLPELNEPSSILTEHHRRLLSQHLPARTEGYTWTLIYSTWKHGFSLKTLYREMMKIESPILLVIQDTCGAVFGALTSHPLRTSDLFYGTGESFLFTFYPDFETFTWAGHNQYFIKGNSDSLVIGAGAGNFGIWLDEDLCHGRSQSCETFANPRLSKDSDFIVEGLECWTFT